MNSQTPIQVLLIEDNPGDRRLLQELLREVDSVPITFAYADCLSQGIHSLRENDFDLILLDLFLPDSQGFATFTQLQQRERETPIIVTTGLNDETLALRAVQAGAQDYLVKGQITGDLLVRSIRYAIERKRAEQKIREQAALLDIATDAILVRDARNQILFWNKGAERLYGWTVEEALEKNSFDLLYDDMSTQAEEAQQKLVVENEWQGELQQITKTGQVIVVESRWTLVRDEEGQPKFILVVSTDITDKKQLETQFYRAQRLESLGTLAGGIAHDLNNMLTPILGIAKLLPHLIPDIDQKTSEFLEILTHSTERGAELVKQVLTFARGIEGQYQMIPVENLISEVNQLIEHTFPKSVEISASVADDLWMVTGDTTHLHQVLMNLCVNARDAMPDGGQLSLTAKNVWVEPNLTQGHPEAQAGPHVMITVQDTGTGISPQILDRVFEPFFTTKGAGQGTGLGLSTVIGILKSHKGFIQVASQSGQGTQFKIYLPAVNAEAGQSLVNPQADTGQGQMILVVDDEGPIREITKTILEAYNYRALTACDGIEAIALYRQYGPEISAVLIDLMMPKMGGEAVIRALRQIEPQVQLIATSGLASNEQKEITQDLGVSAFLPKPYTPEALLHALSELGL
ncbi:hybrid sensor histidine kinase/response regulator [Sphaerothrix gracilis]|uniref:hybrid sensor histidine kinase/response regulator n=1 Tax=Sphaerothrix gracilis TaxID=3151835 RepID=UPI0031FDAE6C